MSEKIVLPKDSNRLPGVFITGESITNMNNSLNIQKKSKPFLDVPIWTGRSGLKKEARNEKPRDTVP
jgi:hypothetical protein